jgi:hypothetical protein
MATNAAIVHRRAVLRREQDGVVREIASLLNLTLPPAGPRAKQPEHQANNDTAWLNGVLFMVRDVLRERESGDG